MLRDLCFPSKQKMRNFFHLRRQLFYDFYLLCCLQRTILYLDKGMMSSLVYCKGINGTACFDKVHVTANS